MLKYPEATPCPVIANPTPFAASTYEPTEELNFTTEIQVALRQAGPRRRKSIRPQKRHDEVVTQAIAAERSARTVAGGTQYHYKRSERATVSDIPQLTNKGPLPALRHTSVLSVSRQGELDDPKIIKHQHEGANQQAVTHMHKKPRRRTIYVPSDDTTVFTIHPGMHSDARNLADYSLSAITQSDAGRCEPAPGGIGQGQRANRKPLAAAPKRAPLQPTLKTLQETEDQHDIAGTGPGKENLPPCAAEKTELKSHRTIGSRARRVSIFGAIPEGGAYKADELPLSDRLSPSGHRSNLRINFTAGATKNRTHSSVKSLTRRDPRESMMNRRNSLYYGSTWKAPLESRPDEPLARHPSKLMAPETKVEIITKMDRFSILHENIDRPEMFEDAWLEHQECAIQQLINGLFETVSPNRSSGWSSDGGKRTQLLQLYQGAECSLLYKRIQASLFYGALSPPEGSIADSSRLKCDVGLRQKLLSIWTGTYDLESLSAAVEVVIGRELDSTLSASANDHRRSQTTKRPKRDLEQLITSCLLHNEDAAGLEQLSPLWCWRRTVLRSLMIILLLDKAKETRLVSKNLFQASSRLKSSRSVLAEISTLLVPSVGDVYRPLSHLDYHVHYTQFPLVEYQYKVANLATDLRDGVNLTRLVELLLWPPQSPIRVKDEVTVAMPTGELLMSTIEDGVLSQHLKFPCISRVQKLYNVQIALSALKGICGVGKIAEALSPEDIVDGHREKTVTLLWGLVGKWGLDSLVDFSALGKEIRRLQRTDFTTGTGSPKLDEEDNGRLEGLEKQTYLLESWAQTIARQNGLQVLNLTTSFADGKVFGKIIDEYHSLLSHDGPSQSAHSAERRGQLGSKLRGIGCSASFGKHGLLGPLF